MKTNRTTTRNPNPRRPRAFALLVTMLVLVALTALAAGLSVRLTAANRRQSYMIEYQRARYGLDSGLKYILSELPRKNFPVRPRPEVPDFSDVFWMTEAEYAQFMSEWAQNASDEQLDKLKKPGATFQQQQLSSDDLMDLLTRLMAQSTDTGDDEDAALSDANQLGDFDGLFVYEVDPNDLQVPGPYGPPWPYVMEPIELEIGDCKITITVEDENAKMPLSWLVTNFEAANKKAQYSLATFGEWMCLREDEIKQIKAAMEEIYTKHKRFTLNPSPVMLQQTAAAQNTQTQAGGFNTSRRNYTRTPGAGAAAAPPAQAAQANQRSALAHATDFAKLFHSSLLDRAVLERPMEDTGQRVENALKYLSLWGAQRVNINTAPRHVLEATFILATDPVDVVHQIIQRRREAPFRRVDELKTEGLLDNDTFDELKNYITTTSTFFKIRVVSRSGNAAVSAVATVIKEGRQTERLAIIYE